MTGLEFTTGPILFFLGAILYFLPAAVAYGRGHHNAAPLFIVNLFFGWTLLGWVAVLAWSMCALPDTRSW